MFALVTARYLWNGKCQCNCEKGWKNVIQRAEIQLVNKDKAAAIFSICTEHHSQARNRDLGFISAR